MRVKEEASKEGCASTVGHITKSCSRYPAAVVDVHIDNNKKCEKQDSPQKHQPKTINAARREERLLGPRPPPPTHTHTLKQAQQKPKILGPVSPHLWRLVRWDRETLTCAMMLTQKKGGKKKRENTQSDRANTHRSSTLRGRKSGEAVSHIQDDLSDPRSHQQNTFSPVSLCHCGTEQSGPKPQPRTSTSTT